MATSGDDGLSAGAAAAGGADDANAATSAPAPPPQPQPRSVYHAVAAGCTLERVKKKREEQSTRTNKQIKELFQRFYKTKNG
jgi:hypothetical protein